MSGIRRIDMGVAIPILREAHRHDLRAQEEPQMSATTTPTTQDTTSPRVLVWDLPIRIFHWLLAASFLLAWVLAVTSDDESRAFAVHGLLGLFIGALVIFRLVWGLIGTRHTRFSGFANSPAALAAYSKGILFGPTREYVGHNPASSYVTWAMLILLVGLIWTGLQMGSGNESVEELRLAAISFEPSSGRRAHRLLDDVTRTP
jgi:cytochrome b